MMIIRTLLDILLSLFVPLIFLNVIGNAFSMFILGCREFVDSIISNFDSLLHGRFYNSFQVKVLVL